MSAGFELTDTMFSARVTPWHDLGEVVDGCLTAKEALVKSGLDWMVVKRPTTFLWTDGQHYEHKDRFSLVRDSDLTALGVVSDIYVPVQNVEAFEFFDNVVDSGEAKYETAGSLRGGRRIWLTALVPEPILIGGMDRVDIYLLLTNSHDGRRSLRMDVTPVRTVCENTLNMAIARSERSWQIRHTTGLEEKVAEARDALAVTFKYVEVFETEMNKLFDAKITDKAFATFAEKIAKSVSGSEKSEEKAKEAITVIFKTAPTLKEVRGTKWAALNAVGEYMDWFQPRNTDSQLESTWFDKGQRIRTEALALLRG